MAPASPLLVMIAGPNGSGKTTLIQALRASGEIARPELYINADDLRRQRGLDARGAQKLAETLRLEAIAHRRSFMYETVMSHPSKIAELQAAALAGYTIAVVFVATADPGINIERVALRVADGGHDVPKDRIRARHGRSRALAPSALAFAAYAYVYDNTPWGTEAAQQLQAVLAGGLLQPVVERPARWVNELIAQVDARTAELEDLYHGARDRGKLVVPNLHGSTTEGAVVASRQHYALQADAATGKTVIHDQALLSKAVRAGSSYRIEYDQGVSKVTRRPSTRLSAIKKTQK